MSYNLNANKDVSRATMLAISDVSKVNEYTIASSFTSTHPISLEHNRRLINEIIDNTFDELKGTCEVSSSQCSSMKLQSSEYSYDKRLEYWKNVLKERQMLSAKIQKQTKKNQCEILYNRLVTVDERDKFTIQNLMDYAERLNPTTVSAKQPSKLKEKCNNEMMKLLPELQETLPLAERRKAAIVEISGLPKAVQKELLGKASQQGGKKPFSWLNSTYLGKRIEEKVNDIERIMEYYPDIENLQVVGEGLLDCKESEHNSNIQITSANDVCKISHETLLEAEINETQTVGEVTKPLKLHDFAVKVNDQEFFAKNCCKNSFETLNNFKCFPFESEIKKIFTIENIGKKVLDFQWVHSSFYYKNSTLLKCNDNEFLFDNLPFRLCSGEVQEIFVKFQPRKVCVVKSKWILKVKPTIFKRKMKGIAMRLSGECPVPLEYERKLNEMQREVIEKSNQHMMKTLTSNLADLAIELQPADCYCPYQRSLNEIELFEKLNSGFKCDRYNDLELLKELHKRAKKPRDKPWDLQVNTLKSIILKVPHAETRALFFNELCGILNSMRGSSVDLEIKTSDNVQAARSRFLYVRSIILTAIDEWINLTEVLEETFYQTSLQALEKEFATENQVEAGSSRANKNTSNSAQEEAKRRQFVVEKYVRKLKPYRDSLYMQTYTLMCNFVENIVNIIESNV